MLNGCFSCVQHPSWTYVKCLFIMSKTCDIVHLFSCMVLYDCFEETDVKQLLLYFLFTDPLAIKLSWNGSLVVFFLSSIPPVTKIAVVNKKENKYLLLCNNCFNCYLNLKWSLDGLLPKLFPALSLTNQDGFHRQTRFS